MFLNLLKIILLLGKRYWLASFLANIIKRLAFELSNKIIVDLRFFNIKVKERKLLPFLFDCKCIKVKR